MAGWESAVLESDHVPYRAVLCLSTRLYAGLSDLGYPFLAGGGGRRTTLERLGPSSTKVGTVCVLYCNSRGEFAPGGRPRRRTAAQRHRSTGGERR